MRVRRLIVAGLLGCSLRFEALALRLAEPREGDLFDAELSVMLDLLVARAEASGAKL